MSLSSLQIAVALD